LSGHDNKHIISKGKYINNIINPFNACFWVKKDLNHLLAKTLQEKPNKNSKTLII